MSVPRKTRIAEYWAARERAVFAVDLLEPACFACGWWQEHWDAQRRPWEAARLQRCHLTPKSLGGPDAVENLVLLCISCHRAAPDHVNPEWMIRWIQSRDDWFIRRWHEIVAEVIQPLAQLGVPPDDATRYLTEPRFRDRVLSECAVHEGQLALSTVTAALVEHHLAAAK
jgi:hypothetical protein